MVVSLGTCIYFSRATPEKLMAQEGREARRAASRYPHPSGARRLAAVEKSRLTMGRGRGLGAELGFGSGARVCGAWEGEADGREREGEGEERKKGKVGKTDRGDQF